MIAPHKSSYPTSQRSVIQAAKGAVSTLDLAGRLCSGELRRAGKEWVARCPLPNHEDRTPSFCVNSERDLWFCHGCVRGGDVISLAQRAWGMDRADVAAAEILLTFGHPIPPRPASWFRRQERQRDTRAAIEQTRKNTLRRRLFKYCVLPLLDYINDEEEYNRELERAWVDFQEMLP